VAVVADASVLVEAIGGSAASPAAQWARGLLAAQTEVVTCDLADIECVSAWRRQRGRGQLTGDELAQLVDALRRAPLTRVPSWALTDRVLQLADNLTPFDAAYVAAAEGLGLPLATLDARLAQAPGIRCRVLTPDPA